MVFNKTDIYFIQPKSINACIVYPASLWHILPMQTDQQNQYLGHSSATFSNPMEGSRCSASMISGLHSSSTRCVFLPLRFSFFPRPLGSESRRLVALRIVASRREGVFCRDKRRSSKIKALSLDSVQKPASRSFRKAFDMVHALWHCRIWAYGASSVPRASQPHQKQRGLCGSPHCRPPFSKRRLEEG